MYLYKYTKGAVKSLVGSFMSESHLERTYMRARNAVHTRYGDKTKIAVAVKAKLNSWTPVREGDANALLQFSDFLLQCNSSMSSLKYLANLDCQEENLRIAQKLPESILTRWLREVDRKVYGKDYDVMDGSEPDLSRYPTFDDFSRFVANEARILNSYGRHPSETRIPIKRHTTLVSGVDGATDTGGTKPGGGRTQPEQFQRGREEKMAGPCVFCTGDHHLSACAKFLENHSEFKKVYARSKGLCYGCLRRSHLIRDCRVKNRSLMASPERKSSMRTGVTVLSSCVVEPRLYSLIVPVWVRHAENAGHAILTYAMIDTQSDGTFMTGNLARRLGIELEPVELEVKTLEGTSVINSGRTRDLIIQGEHQNRVVKLPEVFTKEELPGDRTRIPDRDVVAQFDHLKDIAKYLSPIHPEVQIEMLIGYNSSGAIKFENSRASEKSNLFAVRTPLGWAVSGNVGKPYESSTPVTVCYRTRVKVKSEGLQDATPEQMKRVFNQDFGGEDSQKALSAEDIRFLDIVREEIRMVDGHFEIPLPLKYWPTDMPNSRPSAYASLMGLRRKFKRKPVFAEKYIANMKKVIENEAEPVPDPGKIPAGEKWYWEHLGVEDEDKPDVVRGVYNGRKRVQGFCINDVLLQGPDLTNNLVGVLCRYREERTGVKCDIKNMFPQVWVTPKYRNLLSFLWFKDYDPEKEVVEYRMKVHLFGAASSPACANYALKETARRFGHKYDPEVERFVKENFYVDDGLGSQRGTEEAVKLAMGARGLCAEGGFDLRKFASNDHEVMKTLPKEIVAPKLQDVQFHEEPLPRDKALGIHLSLEHDAFEYDVKLEEKPLTRRGCLSALSSIYDPLGFIAPCILEGRRLLQEMCGMELGWDDPTTLRRAERSGRDGVVYSPVW